MKILYLLLLLTEVVSAGSFKPTGKPITLDAGTRCSVPYWAVSDFNSDGNKDIVLAMPSTTVFTSRALSSEPFVLSVIRNRKIKDARNLFVGNLPTFELPTDVYTEDLNGDNKPDLFISDAGIDSYKDGIPVGPWIGSTPKISLSTGSGLLDVSSAYSSYPASFIHSSTVADIDRDGDIDIYSGSTLAAQGKLPYLMINDGLGNFTINTDRLPQFILGDTGNWTVLPDGGVKGSGNQYTGSLFVDINNDGYKDLVLMQSVSTPRSVVLINTNGSFNNNNRIELPIGLFGEGQITTYSNGNNITRSGNESLNPRAVDINKDGYMDLVIENTLIDPTNLIFYRHGRIQILINNQGQGFTDETDLRGSPGFMTDRNYDSYHGRLTITDFNNDGFEDIIAVRVNGSYESYIYLNDGSGKFYRHIPKGIPRDGFIVPFDKNRVVLFTTKDNREIPWENGVAYTCKIKSQIYTYKK